MSISAYLIDADHNQITDGCEIDRDDEFAALVTEAQEAAANGAKCAIRWERDSDGQVAYWGVAGASLKPQWFARMGRPELPPEDKTSPHTIYFTDAEWSKIQGAPKGWVRGLVQRAEAPKE